MKQPTSSQAESPPSLDLTADILPSFAKQISEESGIPVYSKTGEAGAPALTYKQVTLYGSAGRAKLLYTDAGGGVTTSLYSVSGTRLA